MSNPGDITQVCRVCSLAQQRVEDLPAGMVAICRRCGTTLARSRPDSLRRTAALSLAALILYVPANVYPILSMDFYGARSESTVWDGCVRLFHDGQWPVAGIVFLFSMVVPLLKLLGLFFLVSSTQQRSVRFQRARTRLCRLIIAVGPWAMLDVFLLAVLVALVKLGKLATVVPGPGLVAFAIMVVLSMLAAASFDPRLIWNLERKTT